MKTMDKVICAAFMLIVTLSMTVAVAVEHGTLTTYASQDDYRTERTFKVWLTSDYDQDGLVDYGMTKQCTVYADGMWIESDGYEYRFYYDIEDGSCDYAVDTCWYDGDYGYDFANYLLTDDQKAAQYDFSDIEYYFDLSIQDVIAESSKWGTTTTCGVIWLD